MFQHPRAVATVICCSVITAIAANASEIQDAAVERRNDQTLVQWQTIPKGTAVDVALQFPGEQQLKLISDDDRDGQHVLAPEDAARRPLVHLTTSTGAGFVTAERLLPLERGRNFRDLGGYRTQDGRRIKWGHVYRSGTMANLSDADYDFLSTLGIRVICDFRANEEREREPTQWQQIGVKLDYRSRDYLTESTLREILQNGEPTVKSVRNAMLNAYRAFPYQHADSYRTMFESLARAEAPLAFNCAAGKDRTGVGAALLLTMLGVPRDTIVEDYALSEKVVNYDRQLVQDIETKDRNAKPNPYAFLAKLPADVRAPLMRSDPEYVRTALEHIEQREGSIDAYFERVLKISKEQQATIRNTLLEPAASVKLSATAEAR